MADSEQRKYDKLLEKEEAYDKIESETSGWFSTSSGLRTPISAGVADIGNVFQGGEYRPNMSAPWRNNIENERKKTIEEIEKKIATVEAER